MLARVFSVILAALICGCAQVPKQSVDLSTTIGRDIREMQQAHVAFVNSYYDKLESEISRFVDDVYVPYQVEHSMTDFEKIFMVAIQDAKSADPTGERQKNALGVFSVYLTQLRANIEAYRMKRLQPVKDQRQMMLKRLNEGYARIINANSVVTGYLASVVKITDEQNDLLSKLGLPNLSSEMADRGTQISERIETLRTRARADKTKVKEAVDEFDDVLKAFQK